VTVVYNGVDFIEEAICSVISQTYNNIEYIIIDGGSIDGTVEIIESYEKYVSWWVSESDSGIYDAMNKGIINSNGAIVGLLNADDVLYPDSVARIVNKFGDDFLNKYTCGPVDIIDERSAVIGRFSPFSVDERISRRYIEMPCPHLSVFVSKNVYIDYGIYDDEYALSADYDFILRLIDNCLMCIDLDFPVGGFRRGGASGGCQTWIETRRITVKHGQNIFLSYYYLFRSVIKSSVASVLPVYILRSINKMLKSQNSY